MIIQRDPWVTKSVCNHPWQRGGLQHDLSSEKDFSHLLFGNTPMAFYEATKTGWGTDVSSFREEIHIECLWGRLRS